MIMLNELTRKQKKTLYRIIAAGALFILCVLLPTKGYIRGLIFLVPYFTIGYDILKRAGLNIIHGQLFDENFLMALATIGALAIGEYPEAVFVMLFYQVGELFQSIAVGKSRRAITDLMDISPEFARVKRGEEYVKVDPSDVKIGEIILVKPGEKIPLDGSVVSGSCTLDTSALTGESMPRDAAAGEKVISGCIDLTSPIEIVCEKEYGDSTVAKILELVENSSVNKAKTENFITKFARVYTPVVVLAAVLTAFVPPMFGGDVTLWLTRALSFLVVSCPCALVISVPLSFFSGIGEAGKRGILIKGSNYIEVLAKCEAAVFDKTGTLTKGTFEVTRVLPKDCSEDGLLRIAAKCEAFSNHPIAASLRKAYGMPVSENDAQDVTELPGRGVSALVEGKRTFAGNRRLMEENGIAFENISASGTVVYIACEKEYLGAIVIEDKVKENAPSAIQSIKKLGVKRTVMLTGDTELSAAAAAQAVNLDELHHSLLPDKKVEKLNKILSEKGNGTVIYVGDGVNDAPVLKLADVGIAMGAMGSDAAIEAADIVLMDDGIEKLPLAIKIAKKTMRIVRENIAFSLIIKIGVLLLVLFGAANMWQAVFADVGVMVIAVLNATLRKAVK